MVTLILGMLDKLDILEEAILLDFFFENILNGLQLDQREGLTINIYKTKSDA